MARKKKQYGYRRGNFNVGADVAWKELKRIEKKEGGITPAMVVDESRDEAAPLHDVFDWDDATAAENYREQQASELIRCVCVVRPPDEEGGPTVRTIAFVSVVDEESHERQYVSTAVAMGNETYKAQVLADALAQLNGFRRRFGHLEELAGVFAAISEVTQPAPAP